MNNRQDIQPKIKNVEKIKVLSNKKSDLLENLSTKLILLQEDLFHIINIDYELNDLKGYNPDIPNYADDNMKLVNKLNNIISKYSNNIIDSHNNNSDDDDHDYTQEDDDDESNHSNKEDSSYTSENLSDESNGID